MFFDDGGIAGATGRRPGVAAGGERQQGLSPKTVNNGLSLANVMLKTALEWAVISVMPVRIRLLKSKGGEVNFYEPDEYERLVEAASKLDKLIQATVLLGGEAGLRSGEMLGLQWGDLDFVRGVLHVRRAIWMGQVTLPKSGKGRTIPMTKRLADCLKAQRHLVREEVLHRPDGEQATRATCTNGSSGPRRRQGCSRSVNGQVRSPVRGCKRERDSAPGGVEV